MGTNATRPTKKPHAATVTTAGSFFRGSGAPGFFSPVMRKAGSPPTLWSGVSVSRPDDALELAADRTADRVMRTPAAPAPTPGAASEPLVQRAAEPLVQRATAAAAPTAAAPAGLGPTPTTLVDVRAAIARETTGGQPLPADIRTFMEPRLGADLGGVRVHADETAARLSNHLGARAFTYGRHVFFARDQYRPGTSEGRYLLAHELAHTVQQGGGAPTPEVQRWGVSDVLDYFAEKAYHVPGFRMLTLVLGFNPINMSRTPRTAANFLRALIELVPGGHVITQVLDNHRVIDRAAAWVEQKVAVLGDIGSQIIDGLERFIDSLGWRDIFRLGSVWERAKRIFTDPIGRLVSFGKSVVVELLTMVKDAILRPLAALAQGTRGYDLLKAILGRDPVTGDPYPRTPDTLIGGFMKLIGQQEVWENLKRGKAVSRAYAWFQQTLSGLLDFVLSVPRQMLATLKSLTFTDVITVVGAFRKVGSALLGIAGRFGSWALGQVLGLLEILVSVVAPRAVPYVAKSRAAFHTIIRDPVRFVGNLVRAGKLGFQMFAGNFLKHLKDALITWLIGPLGEAGVYIPTSFSLLEIVKLVLSVLGLTWANIRTKLLRIIPEPVLQALEKTASVLVTLATQGPVAAWEQIKAELTELKTQLVGQVTRMIQIEVVKAAVKKLAMMLNPAGAVIQAILAIWSTVSFFISKINQIGAVVASFVDSIAAIAAGQVMAAAKRVELTLARTLVVVIGFLAKFAGLGNIPTKLVGIVKKVRAPIDKGLDRIVGWLGGLLKKIVATAKETAKKLLQWWKKKVPISGGDKPHTLTFTGEAKTARLVVQSDPTDPVVFMRETATQQKVEAKESKPPIDSTTTHVGVIRPLQAALAAYDDNDEAAVSNQKRTDANAKAGLLDKELALLAGVIGKALSTWIGAADEVVTFTTEISEGKVEFIKEFRIARGGFSDEAKEAIAERARQQGTGQHLRPTTRAGKVVGAFNVAAGIARRHVVSAGDMRAHYMTFLHNKKASAAKLLLEQRGAISGARTPVGTPVTAATIRAAAVKRYANFFGYARNIFLGDSQENSSIQENLDKGNPELAGKKLWEHVDRIKRGWALDQSFTPTDKK